MMTVLHLTEAEQKLFDALPADVKEGWTVENESRMFTDSPKRYAMRLSFLRLRDPQLLELKEKLQGAKPEQIASLLQEVDLKDVQQSDLAELFFALGPAPIYTLIEYTLKNAQSDREVEAVAGLGLIRGALLKSFSTHFAS